MFFSSGRIPAGLHITNGKDGVLQPPVFLLYSPLLSGMDEVGFLTFGKRGTPTKRKKVSVLRWTSSLCCLYCERLTVKRCFRLEQVAQPAVQKLNPVSEKQEAASEAVECEMRTRGCAYCQSGKKRASSFGFRASQVVLFVRCCHRRR